jgi:hypothetical protein
LLPGNKLNLWRGYGVEACKGDWPLMQQHIKRILADGISEACDYITRYAAWIVQNPGERPGVALVLRGGEGTGKGSFYAACFANSEPMARWQVQRSLALVPLPVCG